MNNKYSEIAQQIKTRIDFNLQKLIELQNIHANLLVSSNTLMSLSNEDQLSPRSRIKSNQIPATRASGSRGGGTSACASASIRGEANVTIASSSSTTTASESFDEDNSIAAASRKANGNGTCGNQDLVSSATLQDNLNYLANVTSNLLRLIETDQKLLIEITTLSRSMDGYSNMAMTTNVLSLAANPFPPAITGSWNIGGNKTPSTKGSVLEASATATYLGGNRSFLAAAPLPAPSSESTAATFRHNSSHREKPVHVLSLHPNSNINYITNPSLGIHRPTKKDTSHPPAFKEERKSVKKDRKILPLATDEDRFHLSKFLTFLRAECIEVFTATEEDVMERMSSQKVKIDQVGIRCRFCAHLKQKQGRSSNFPSEISGIYQGVSMMIYKHFKVCDEMPHDLRVKFIALKTFTKKGDAKSRPYWEYSAKKLGMRNCPDTGGIRLVQTKEATDEL